MSANVTDYEKILPVGKQNAVSTAELAVIMGFGDSRSLQADIAKSRDAGQIILSSTSGLEFPWFYPQHSAFACISINNFPKLPKR